VAFVSLRDNLDLTTSSGRALCHIIGAMAEFEHDLIGERVKAGMARAKAEGKHIGRSRAKVDVVRIRQLRAEKLSYSDIAKKLRRSRAVIWKRLNLPAQKGW
jgi:DNA invertase Pin-like site-specific DNA recombinase